MQYIKTNGIHIVDIPVGDFKIVMVDTKKKTAAESNYVNAGFFGVYKGSNGNFTLPVGHLVCDFDAPAETERYCEERGKFVGKKYYFNSSTFSYMNQLYRKAVSTLVVANGKAYIDEITDLPDCDYAVAGIPVMRGGKDVSFAADVKTQGWDSSPLYATWHTLVGLKADRSKVYVIALRTYTANMVASAEAYKKLKKLGFVDVIKLDGGGSFILDVNGQAVASTSENRRINTIIVFGDGKNPYPVPAVTLRRGNSYTQYNKWLQWQLNTLGFKCEVDGSFGPNTERRVKNFQESKGLEKDGSVGPLTRAALNN